MGVPKFYRWISERYPCLSEVIKEYQIPEFDNLYLDMNGIIHVCSHPNDEDPHFRISEEKIFADICHYIDFLFKMIKPQKVFFMAVDGVAPRAKMNQQRGRRFRTARDATYLEQKAREGGESLPQEARFDSNCITPGTVFMARLHEVLKHFVSYKISTDKLWQNVRVYLSGHETPGEGEHKIMDFIRYEKSQDNYNPNIRHCLYGLDADLIMLGLCSHEPHFSLLREEVRFGKKANQKRIVTPEETTFHLLHLSLLREYLEHEFEPAKEKINFEFNVEKIIDDFVLMSFLVGNDFIPHLPLLHIHHDALPLLFKSYMEVLPSLGGYINEGGYLNLERFELFFKKLTEFDYQKFGELSDFPLPGTKPKLDGFEEATENCLEKLADLGFSKESLSKTTEFDSESDDESDDFELEFRQHKHDYYRNKLEYDNVTPEVLRDQAEGYVRAIQWNLHYYYNGVASWSWYYPHHYAPYISDVKDFKGMNLDFELGQPFVPFQQLLAVLPSLSKNLLPLSYQKLMTDPESPLLDYYPQDFETDLNGKKQDWEAIVLIPFINEKLLLKCTSEADALLSEEERQRNQHGPHLLYTYSKKAGRGLTLSFLPDFFPTLESTHAKCQKLPQDFFRLPVEKIKKGLCPNVFLDVHFPGFPTLKLIKHTARLSNEDVKVFQMVSQRDNMMLTVTEIEQTNLEVVANSLLGTTVHVGWPHLVEGLVMMVSDEENEYCWEKSQVVKRAVDVGIWKSKVESVKDHHHKRLGIILGDINILVHARCLTGKKLVWDDEIKEDVQWTEACVNFPLKTIVKTTDTQHMKIAKNCKELYPSDSAVFMLGNPYYGCMGYISDNNVTKNRGKIFVKFDIPEEPDMNSVIRNKKKLASLKYMPGYVLAQHLGISGYFLSRLTGTFLIQTNSKESISPNRVNIGLNLKFNKKNEEVAGYSKKTEDNQWLYSDQVLNVLENYLRQFPDFFEALVPLTEQDVVYLEDLYPDGNGKEILKEVTNWLKSQQCTSAERQTCGLNTLDEGIVSAIEDVVNEVVAAKKVTKKNISVKPQDLYSPFLCKGCVIPDGKAVYQLFDRVINVRHNLTVPLGLRGTVIGIRGADKLCDYIYEVVFDKEFFGGIKLHCTAGRGYRMPPSALINISHGNRMTGSTRSPRIRVDQKAKDRIGAHLSSNDFSPAQPSSKLNNATFPAENQTAQFQILRKENQQPNQPFYKNGSLMLSQTINHSPNSSFMPLCPNLSWDSPQQQFVMPKANQAGGRNSIGSAKTASPLVNNTEYDTLWSGLLNKSDGKFSPSKGANPDVKPRKKSFTVDELFSAFENSEKPRSTRSSHSGVHSSQQKQEACVELMNYSTKMFGAPPTYSYQQLGFNNWHIATAKLPDGRTFASVQCPTKADAVENAAEKALAILRGGRPHDHHQRNSAPKIVENVNFNNHYRTPQYYQNEYRMPVPNIPSHPLPPFNVPPPPIRYPSIPIQMIPESFVKQNKLILEGHIQQAPVRHFVPNTTIPILSKDFSIPKKSEPTDESNGTKTKESVFVPLQVLRNSTKKPQGEEPTPLVISEKEWPTLNESKIVKPLVSPTISSSNSNSTIEVTGSLETLPKKIVLRNETVPPLIQGTSEKEAKPRKMRIAASIPNLS